MSRLFCSFHKRCASIVSGVMTGAVAGALEVVIPAAVAVVVVAATFALLGEGGGCCMVWAPTYS